MIEMKLDLTEEQKAGAKVSLKEYIGESNSNDDDYNAKKIEQKIFAQCTFSPF